MTTSTSQAGAVPHVSVRRDPDPYTCTRTALDALVLPDCTGVRVLVKPNAGRSVEAETGVTTHPQVVAAVCDLLLEKGADVTIGEGTIVGEHPLPCLEKTGIAAVAVERNIPMVDLDAAAPKTVCVEDGLILESLSLSSALDAYDYIVSVPVMKTHMHCRVSLSAKNMKGCLRGREKVRLHQLPQPEIPTEYKTLDMAIADLVSVYPPDLAVIDGTYAQEGLGPSGGTMKRFNTVVASTDFLSADAVAATLMGFEPAGIPHLALAAARGCGVIDCDAIRVAPPEWKQYTDSFATPPQKLSIEFPDITVLDEDSCSACVSTLLLFLKRYYSQMGDYLPLTVAIGKGHDELPPGTLCVGNCTSCARLQEGSVHVKGCPPVASDILQQLRDEHSSR